MITLKDNWLTDDPFPISYNSDGSVRFDGPIGDVFLPDDYKWLLTKTDGLVTRWRDSWFIARYPAGAKLLELEELSTFHSVMNGTWGFQESLYHDGFTVPSGYIKIGTAEGDANYTSVILSVRRGEWDYGHVYTWMESPDPWMEGSNTQGLGAVAPSFTDFVNGLSAKETL